MQSKLNRLVAESANTGLKTNVATKKAMKINMPANSSPLLIADSPIEAVESFVYLGSTITTDGGALTDALSRISKARSAFAQLHRIWSSSSISVHTKIRLFNFNVKSVLLYGCETWLTSESLLNKLQVFINRCLRKILRVWWPDTISNSNLWSKCKQLPIAIEIKKRKWNWIGHTLRKPTDEICRQALTWNPQGSRRTGRPKLTWKRCLEREIQDSGRSLGELKVLAKNRKRWKELVEALCSTGS